MSLVEADVKDWVCCNWFFSDILLRVSEHNYREGSKHFIHLY